VKTTDLIQFGLGFGRFIRTEKFGPIQGIDPTAGPIYETNYELTHKNLLFAADTQFYFAGTDHSLKQLNYIKYLDWKKKHPDAEPQDAPKAFHGYRWRFFAGMETGSQVSDETAKASSGTSKVQVPGYAIARIKPHVSLDLEFSKVITLSLSGTPRYLLTTENVYRERDVLDASGQSSKQVYLTTVTGWRPYGQSDLSLALDDAGHYALSSTLKVGSLPPNFQRVVSVQSGLTIKF
jgi:hypothetical protein